MRRHAPTLEPRYALASCCFAVAFVLAIRLQCFARDDSQKPLKSPENAFLLPGIADPGWTFVRGPTYDGHSPEINLADTWPAEGPPVLWTRELGQGYSALVADKGRVFTQYQTLAGQYLICLDGDTGRTIWEYRYDWPFEAGGVYPGPRATPTLAHGHVYIASPSGKIECVTATDGRSVWSRNVNQDFRGSGTDFGYACSPLVIEDLVVLPVGGRGASLVALDASTGATRWQSGDDSASYTPAFPISFAGKQLVVGYLQNALVVCELTTGRQLCRVKLSSGYDEHSAWPIYAEPYLWISGPFRAGSELLKLSGTDELQISTVWKKSILSNDILSSVLVGEAIYGFDVADAQAKTHRPTRGSFRCIDLLTGEEHWSNASMSFRETQSPNDGSPRIGHSSVIAADGKLYLFNDTGELILARATTMRYEELARAKLLSGEIVWTPPTLHQGRLYLRNHSRAVCVYVGRRDLLLPKQSIAAISVRDVPQSEYRDWAALVLGVEPEFAFDLPSTEWFRRWYLISLLGVFTPAIFAGLLIWFPIRKRVSAEWVWRVTGITAFFLGAVGTTLFSRWLGEFMFTWPVCLFVAFQSTMLVIPLRHGQAAHTTWLQATRSLAILAIFMLVCLAYFFACRRFSLIFQWAFLAGFFCAVPFGLTSRWFTARFRGPARFLGELFSALCGFTAFYWSSVALLWARYS